MFLSLLLSYNGVVITVVVSVRRVSAMRIQYSVHSAVSMTERHVCGIIQCHIKPARARAECSPVQFEHLSTLTLEHVHCYLVQVKFRVYFLTCSALPVRKCNAHQHNMLSHIYMPRPHVPTPSCSARASAAAAVSDADATTI